MGLKIAIIECQSKAGILIKKLVKKINIETEVDIFPIYKNKFPTKLYDGYIYSGGDARITGKRKYSYLVKLEKITKDLAAKNKHILGICLGCQVIADTFGGKIEPAENLEIGFKKIRTVGKNPILKKVKKNFYTFSYHYDYISKLPKSFENFASSDSCNVHIIKHKKKPIYGVQFHPEFDEANSKRKLKELKKKFTKEELKKLIEDTKLYSENPLIQIMKNYLESIIKNKK